MVKSKGKIVACLDIGTTKMACTIAMVDDQEITLLGYGYRESRGVISGAISDVRLAEKSIANTVGDAEKMAGFNIDRLVVGLSNSQTVSQRKEVSTTIVSDMVKNSDITNLASGIRYEYKKNNRELIHLIPLQYKIDNSTPVQNPRYMFGDLLSSKFHVISTSFTTVKNIENCLKRSQLSVHNYIVESYASALSALSENEMNLGSLVIDIGGSNTSFAVMADGKLVHAGNFPIGGIHVTRDIATILNIDFETAERIKTINNSLIINPLEEKELIKVKSNDERIGIVGVTKLELKYIIESRIEEIINSVKTLLDKSGYGSYLINNIVLTGGTASIIGIEKVVNEVFKRQTRIGFPSKIKNLPSELDDPSFSNVLGMLVFLKNIYLKEKIKDGFEAKGSWFKRLVDYLVSL